jgi:hypothetical protein
VLLGDKAAANNADGAEWPEYVDVTFRAEPTAAGSAPWWNPAVATGSH